MAISLKAFIVTHGRYDDDLDMHASGRQLRHLLGQGSSQRL